MKTITVWHKKGGVGKTTTAFNLAANLGKNGKKVLCIDMDDQCNLSSFFEKDLKRTKGSKKDIHELLDVEVLHTFQNAYYKSHFYNLYFIKGSHINWCRASVFLKQHLQDVSDFFDYVVIDCPPNSTLETTHALEAADLIVTPILLDNFSRDNLNLCRKFLQENDLEKKWVIFANRLRHTKSQKEVYRDLVCNHDYPILKNAVSDNSAVGTALLCYKPLYMHRSSAPVTADFRELTSEVVEQLRA